MRFAKELLSAGHVERAPRLGADAGIGTQDGGRFFASVEPWHGKEVVVYTQHGGPWRRRVIVDRVASGHESAVADLNRDDRDDVIANDNSRPTERTRPPPGRRARLHAPDDAASGQWRYQRVEDTAAMNGCVGAAGRPPRAFAPTIRVTPSRA